MKYFQCAILLTFVLINMDITNVHNQSIPNNIKSALQDIADIPSVYISQEEEDYSWSWTDNTPYYVYKQEKTKVKLKRLTRYNSNQLRIVTLIKSTSQSNSLIGIPNYDIFIFIGSEEILRKFLLQRNIQKLKNKVGVIISSTSIEFLVETTVSGEGKMHSSKCPPNFQINRSNLNGKKFKVSANTLQPFIIVQSDGTRTGGTHYMMLIYAAAHYNFTLEWDISPTRGAGKKLENGTTIGMLGDVLERGYDIAFISRLATGQYGVIDLTTHNSVDTLVFLTRYPKTHLQWTAMVYVFNRDVWIALILLVLGLTPIYFYILKTEKEYTSNDKLFKAFLISYGVTVSQSISNIPPRAYLLTTVWLLFSLILVTYYNSNLSAYLTFLTPETIPHTFDELDLRDDYTVTFNYINQGACDCFHFFEQSKNPMLIRITERFMVNLVPETAECVINSALVYKTVCIGWESVTRQGIASNATLHRQIHLVVVSKSVHSSLNSIGLERYSKFTPSFDRFIGMFRDMGIVQRLREMAAEQEIKFGKQWLHQNSNSEVFQSLNEIAIGMNMVVKAFEIENLLLLFILLATGLILSFGCFCIEFLVKNFKT